MLGIEILCVGKLGQDFYRAGCAEYRKRLGAYARVSMTELPETRLHGESKAEERRVIADESDRLLRHIGRRRAAVVALCVEGERMASARLAAWLQSVAQTRSEVIFVVGGSLGLSDALKERADLRLSMSDMTFPHQLARLMLLEQIYRACSINAGSKYHK